MVKNNLLLALVVFSFILISGCAEQEVEIPPSVQEEIVEDSDQAVQESNAEIQEQVQRVEEEQIEEDNQNKNCVGTGTVKFTSPPMRIEDRKSVV